MRTGGGGVWASSNLATLTLLFQCIRNGTLGQPSPAPLLAPLAWQSDLHQLASFRFWGWPAELPAPLITGRLKELGRGKCHH